MDAFTTHYDTHIFDAGAAEEWRRFFAQAWGYLVIRGAQTVVGCFEIDGCGMDLLPLRAIP